MHTNYADLKTEIIKICEEKSSSKNKSIDKLIQENIQLLDNYKNLFEIVQLTCNQAKRNIGFFQSIKNTFNNDAKPIAEKLLNQYMDLNIKNAEKIHPLSDCNDSQVYKYNGYLIDTLQMHSKELKILLQATGKTTEDLYLSHRLCTADEQVSSAHESQKSLEDYERSVHDSMNGLAGNDTFKY